MHFDCFVPTKIKMKVLITKRGEAGVVLSCTLHASIVKTFEEAGVPFRYKILVLIFIC